MRDPLVPVTVTWNEFAVVELHEKVAVPEPVTLLGLIAPHVSPLGTVSVSATTPVKPFCAVTVIVEVSDAPTVPLGDVTAIENPTTVKVAVAV